MLSLILLQQIAQLFIIIFLGWAIVKAGILKSEDSRVLSMLLLYVIIPCVILNAFQIERTTDTVRMMELSLLSALMMNVLSLVLGKLSAKLFCLNTVETASVMYSNCTNMVVPLVAIAIGLFLFVFQIRLPAVIRSAFAMAGNTMGPVAMLIIGMLMADMDMQHLRSYRQLWKPVLLRLIVLPVILVCVAKYSGLAALAPHGETLIIISLLSVIAPSANIVTQFSQMFGRDALYASLINTVTMLLCIITMPLMITLLQM